jgi:hypothetical protein
MAAAKLEMLEEGLQVVVWMTCWAVSFLLESVRLVLRSTPMPLVSLMVPIAGVYLLLHFHCITVQYNTVQYSRPAVLFLRYAELCLLSCGIAACIFAKSGVTLVL